MAPERIMTREEIRGTLHGINPRIGREFRADIEIFFGSRARSDARDDSNLDVLVRFRERASLYDLVGLGDFLEDIFKRRVEIVSTRSLSGELAPRVSRDFVRV